MNIIQEMVISRRFSRHADAALSEDEQRMRTVGVVSAVHRQAEACPTGYLMPDYTRTGYPRINLKDFLNVILKR